MKRNEIGRSKMMVRNSDWEPSDDELEDAFRSGKSVARKQGIRKQHAKLFLVSYFSPMRGRRLEFIRPIAATSIADAKQQGKALVSNESNPKQFAAREFKENPVKTKATKSKKTAKCSRCGGAHNVAYCNARGAAKKKNGPPAAAPNQNFLGLGKKGKKRRGAKRKLKADVLEAKARYLRAIGNPSGKGSKKIEAWRVEGQKAKAIQFWISERTSINDVLKAARRHMLTATGNQKVDNWAIVGHSDKPSTALPNPMHPLEVGSHLIGIMVGAKALAGHRPKKARRPSATTAGKRLAERKHGSVRGKTKIVKRKIKNGKGSPKSKIQSPKRNHGEIFEEFTGRPSTQVTTGYLAAPGSPKNVDQLGDVLQLTIEDPKGKPVTIGIAAHGTERRINGRVIRLNPGAIKLCATQRNGKRRFVVGIRGEDRAQLLKRYPHARGAFRYGPVAEVVYQARKPHLHNGDSRKHTYYHILGEEGGRRPTLLQVNGFPELKYGNYEIRAEGIRN